jgi:c-di-GMP-binding flagellar brake protein YcgR
VTRVNELNDKRNRDVNRDVGLDIQLGTALQIEFMGFKESAKTVLVGMERGHYLIVRTPSLAGAWTKLHKDNHTTVRYIYEGIVYGFRCTLLGVMSDPFSLLFLSYPQQIETLNLRKQERANCFIPASAAVGDREYRGIIVDISRSGCSFALTMAPEDGASVKAGDEVVFTAKLGESAAERRLPSKIMNVRKDDNKIVMGNLFLELDSDTANAVKNYVDYLMEFSGVGHA